VADIAVQKHEKNIIDLYGVLVVDYYIISFCFHYTDGKNNNFRQL